MLTKYFSQDWIDAIGESVINALLGNINTDLRVERQTKEVLPEAGSPLLFQAFRETPFNSVKVVILGQDPYHDGSYNGLAFGNGEPDKDPSERISPSLRTILKEVKSTYQEDAHPSLYPWARQGVLLINTAHTVVKGIAGSHIPLWANFTSTVIDTLNKRDDIVWMLWGSHAQQYIPLITNRTHSIIKTGHPSPLNRTNPFYESACFSKCDTELMSRGIIPISWV